MGVNQGTHENIDEGSKARARHIDSTSQGGRRPSWLLSHRSFPEFLCSHRALWASPVPGLQSHGRVTQLLSTAIPANEIPITSDAEDYVSTLSSS